MAPFSTQMNRSNRKQTLLLLLLPVMVCGIFAWMYVRDNPDATFTAYQKALRSKSWETVLAESDKQTHDYLSSLADWVWTGQLRDLEKLDAFQQFLVLTTRCKVLGEGLSRPSNSEMFAIWVESLDLPQTVIRSKIINRYNFGETSIGQLYFQEANRSTGLKIHFTDEKSWKVQSMQLIKEAYELKAFEGTQALLRKSNPNYFAQGYQNQHLMPLKMQLETKSAASR